MTTGHLTCAAAALFILAAPLAAQAAPGAAAARPDIALPDVRVSIEGPGATASHASLILAVPPGWAVYTVDPGEMGLPLDVRWEADGEPIEVTAKWPAPERYETPAGSARVHRGRTVAHILLPETFDSGTRLTVSVGWAACRGELCVPGTSRAAIALPAPRAASSETLLEPE